jgi:hypothetical protein
VDRMVEDEAVGTFVICAFFFFFQLWISLWTRS